jgi:hypothetical protein
MAAPQYPQPPDLQALVAQFGSYAAIPAWAWEEFDRAAAAWGKARREFTAGHVIEQRRGIVKRRRAPARRLAPAPSPS